MPGSAGSTVIPAKCLPPLSRGQAFRAGMTNVEELPPLGTRGKLTRHNVMRVAIKLFTQARH